jgi:hypothetical protein
MSVRPDVRSLAGPEPDGQVFAKFKHLSRKVAARSSETIYVTIGEILRAFIRPNAPLAMSNPKKHHALVFVRLAHDRRFVGAFLFILVLFVFIRISHRVAHDHGGTPVDQPGGKFREDVWGHVVAPRVWTLGDFTPSASVSA